MFTFDIKTYSYSLSVTAISPFDDRFLFYVAEKIVNKDEIALGLGLTNSKYEDMKHIQPPSRRMCEVCHHVVLLMVKQGWLMLRDQQI